MRNKILFAGLVSIGLASTAHATKTCAGATCSVPDDCDCSTYQEQVLTNPDSGGEVPHTGELIFIFQKGNCARENSTKHGSLTHQVTWTKSVDLSFTVGVGGSASVKGSVGVPLLANAEATAGITSHIDSTVGGSVSQSTTDTATWQYDVPACEVHKENLLADWKEGSWTKSGYMKGYYYKSSDPFGPIQTVTCDNVSGNSDGASKYYSWDQESAPDEQCSSCN